MVLIQFERSVALTFMTFERLRETVNYTII